MRTPVVASIKRPSARETTRPTATNMRKKGTPMINTANPADSDRPTIANTK